MFTDGVDPSLVSLQIIVVVNIGREIAVYSGFKLYLIVFRAFLTDSLLLHFSEKQIGISHVSMITVKITEITHR